LLGKFNIIDKLNTLNNSQSYKDIHIYMKDIKLFKNSFPKINKITRTEIEKIIKSLNASNTYGLVEITTKFLKNGIHIISSPLTYF
jgi:hypothetical protein